MKQLLILGGFAIFTFVSAAQNSNAILFTENGEKFQIVLNGILQNSVPETNVKLTQLPANHYKCRILFADTRLGYVDFNMVFPQQGYEVTWNVKKNNKGEYVVRYVSDVPLAQAPATSSSQSEVIYTTVPATTTTTTTVQQTTTGGGTGDNVNVNMGVNANGQGGNISFSASGMDGGAPESNYSSTTTTTTTTTRTTTSGSMDTPPPAPVEMVYVQGYNGKIGCPHPISPNEFKDMKETIRSKDFENTKLTIAKQILKDNCLTASQVRELLGLFDFENTKLEFAKYAYDRTYDVGNYYKVNDAFEFESSVDDLNKYISGR
jgi:hypothetical protein